ncbi:MAG: autotransporter domain-containing protein [Gammaproteobacteria bacterium]
MKLKSKKIGLLTQAVLASSVIACLAPSFSVMAAGVAVGVGTTIGAGGAAPDPTDWVQFIADVELTTAAGANNVLAASDGVTPVAITLGLSAATDGTANHGIIKVNDAAGFAPAGGLGEAGANNALNKLYFAAVSTTELKKNAYFANNIDFNGLAATLKLSPQLAGTPLIISAADIMSTGGDNGTITVDDAVPGTQVNFEGKIGDAVNKPTLFNVGTGAAAVTAYVKGAVNLSAGQIKIFEDAILKVADAVDVTGPINGGAVDKGTLLFEGNSLVANNVGAGASLSLVDVTGGIDVATPKTADFAGDVSAVNIKIAPFTFMQMGGATTITGKIDGSAPGVGYLSFSENGTSAGGDVGGTYPLDYISVHSNAAAGGAKVVNFTGGNVNATLLEVRGDGKNNSTVKFSAPGNQVFGNIGTFTPGKNIVDFHDTAKMTGDVGQDGSKFEQVLIAGAGARDFEITGNIWADNTIFLDDFTMTLNANSVIHGNVITAGGGTGTLTFNGVNTGVTDGNIGRRVDHLKAVNTVGTATANIDADIYATDININGTSTLQVTGNHTFKGNVTAAGGGSTLSLGTNELDVNGAVTFGANDRLQIAITDAGNGKLAITGAVAAIDPTSTLALDTTGGTNTGYINGGTYTVITTTAGGVAVMPVQAGTSAILSGKTVVNGNNLDLVITRTGLDNAAFNPGPQGTGVATALETAGANTNLTQGLQDLMSDLQNLPSTAKVTTALQTLAPNVSGAAVAGSQQGVELGATAIGERMQLARSDVGSYHRGMSAGDVFDNGMGLWAQVVGSDFTQDLRGGVAGYDGNNLGVMFGADWKLTDELLFGVAAGYGTTDIDYDLAASTLNIDTWQASVYGSWQFKEPWFADGMIGVSHHSYDQRRNIILPPSLRVALANYNGWQWNAKVRAGYEHQEGDWHITPAVSLKYSNLSIDDYNETNAGAANLRVSNKSVDSLVAGLGVKAEYRAGMFAPEAHASAYYDFNANSQETNNLFLGSTVGFATNGVKPPHDSYEVGAGLNVYAMDKLQLNLHYDYSFKSDFHSHTGLFQIRYEW